MDWLINRYTVVARTLASIESLQLSFCPLFRPTTALSAALDKASNTLRLLPSWAGHLQSGIASH